MCEFNSCDLKTSKNEAVCSDTEKSSSLSPNGAVLLHIERSRVQISTRILVSFVSQSALTEEAADIMLNQATATSYHPTSK